MGLTGEEKKKYQRDYMAKKRSNKGLTNDGSNTVKPGGSNSLLKRPNGADYNPQEKLPDGSLRYMGPLSDGQVLDRLTCKQVKNVKPALIRRAVVDNKVPSVVNAMVDTDKRRRLIRVCTELKAHNQLSNVSYGMGGPDMASVAEMIEVTG